MNKKYHGLLVALPLTLLAACASDPNKEANDAHNEALKAERKDKQELADQRSDQRVSAADAREKATTAGATGSDEHKDRVEADAKMQKARDVARAKATERLEKVDARTAELKAIVDRKGAKATTASRDLLGAVDKQRVATKQSIEQLSTAPGDNFESAKSNVDGQLDTLEGYVKKAGSEIDKFK